MEWSWAEQDRSEMLRLAETPRTCPSPILKVVVLERDLAGEKFEEEGVEWSWAEQDRSSSRRPTTTGTWGDMQTVYSPVVAVGKVSGGERMERRGGRWG